MERQQQGLTPPSSRGYCVISEWPKKVEIFSHDSGECCWNQHRDVKSEKSCLRLDCRPLYDPVHIAHDGRHADVQAGLLQHKQNKKDCFLDMCTKVRAHPRMGRCCSIAFWCNLCLGHLLCYAKIKG
jgi:hypothetical protein